MEETECIFCQKKSDQIAIEENGYTGRKCPECGLIYISPRPKVAEVQGLYGQDQAFISAQGHISGGFASRLYARHKLKIIKKVVARGSLLEIGAGAGYFLDEASRVGFDVFGIEINPIQADFIRNRLGIRCEETPLEDSTFGNRKFDIIYHCDVLSHLHDPLSAFEKIYNKLTDNGIVVFETGNYADVKKRYYKLITRFQYPDHLYFFGESTLNRLLRITGFQVLRVYTYSMELPLVLNKIMEKMMGRALVNKAGVRVPNYRKGRPGFKSLLKSAYHYSLYLVQYKLGYIAPKTGRPQTVLVIARKTNGGAV